MTSTTSSHWRRVSRRERCPICDKPDWCLVAGPAGALVAAVCARIESQSRTGEAGWLHRLADDGWLAQRSRTISFGAAEQPSPPLSLDACATRYVTAVNADRLECFAAGLGLSVESLRQLGIGWAADKFSWSFPMTDAGGNVLGIRLRALDGRKWSLRGGHEGLFLPAPDKAVGGRLLICEGPTDTAALLDLGFHTVGRPSCTGGVALLTKLVNRCGYAEVVVVADADAPGQRGAERLAAVLLAYIAAVRVITPPIGVKDARAWKQAGATSAEVRDRIETASIRKLTIKAGRKGARS